MTNNPTIDGVSRELTRKQFEEKNEHRGWFVAGGRSDDTGPEGFVYEDFTTDMCWTCYFEASAALQSTIAQLQARIGELESGRGEPVAWMVGAGVWNIQSEAEKYASGRIVTPLYNSSRNKELAACPDGWKIVPITPTTDMKRNGLADRHD